jgi:hypothetical protein
VLKFGSSVLRSRSELPVAVDEIYRRWRAGSRVVAAHWPELAAHARRVH